MRRALPGRCALLVMAALVVGAGIAAAAPGDIVFERADGVGAGFEPATFPHWIHRARYRCYVCHPAIFEMKAGANAVTMASMKKGEHCGACHDGRTAFNVEFPTCARCHRTRED